MNLNLNTNNEGISLGRGNHKSFAADYTRNKRNLLRLATFICFEVLSPMFRISRTLVIILSLVVSLFVVIILRLAYVNTTPTAPIYEHSTFISEFAETSEGIFYPRITYYYQSIDAPEKIVQFYSQNATCELSQSEVTIGRYLCRGKAAPFGEYTVYIDSINYDSEHQTPFVVEVQWKRPFIRF